MKCRQAADPMTEIQFSALANILELSEPDRQAAHAALFGNDTAYTTTQKILSRIKDADSQLRAAYTHQPTGGKESIKTP